MRNLYQNDTAQGECVQIAFSHAVTAAEATANSADIEFSQIDTIEEAISVDIRKADGTYNTAGLDVSFTGNDLTVAATALTEGEIITGTVVSFTE